MTRFADIIINSDDILKFDNTTELKHTLQTTPKIICDDAYLFISSGNKHNFKSIRPPFNPLWLEWKAPDCGFNIGALIFNTEPEKHILSVAIFVGDIKGINATVFCGGTMIHVNSDFEPIHFILSPLDDFDESDFLEIFTYDLMFF